MAGDQAQGLYIDQAVPVALRRDLLRLSPAARGRVQRIEAGRGTNIRVFADGLPAELLRVLEQHQYYSITYLTTRQQGGRIGVRALFCTCMLLFLYQKGYEMLLTWVARACTRYALLYLPTL